jgi:hypothetical protein
VENGKDEPGYYDHARRFSVEYDIVVFLHTRKIRRINAGVN